MKTIVTRMRRPTPKFFKKARNFGMAIAGIGISILAAPITLPVVLKNIAGYLILAGGIMSGVSQSAVKMEIH